MHQSWDTSAAISGEYLKLSNWIRCNIRWKQYLWGGVCDFWTSVWQTPATVVFRLIVPFLSVPSCTSHVLSGVSHSSLSFEDSIQYFQRLSRTHTSKTAFVLRVSDERWYPRGWGKQAHRAFWKGSFWFWNVFVLFLCLLSCHLLGRSYLSSIHWECIGTTETFCSCFSQLCGRRSVKQMRKQNRLDADTKSGAKWLCQISLGGHKRVFC